LCFGDKERKEKRRFMTFVLTKIIDSKVEVVRMRYIERERERERKRERERGIG
jgi:hypothetical protein